MSNRSAGLAIQQAISKSYLLNLMPKDTHRVFSIITFTHLVLNVRDIVHRGSYMSAHDLLNLLNELGKRDKMRGLPRILSLFRNEFN